MPSYTVQQGDHLSKIAKSNGFRDYRTIWDDPQNAALKAARANPDVLLPGDVLYIPAPTQKAETRPTENTHVFKLTAPKLMLRLVLRDFDNQPLPGTKCELEVEGQKYALTTNSKGQIEQSITATAETAGLTVPSLDMKWQVKIGHLDPHDADTGWRQRLINLGYYPKPLADRDDAQLRTWLEEFQCDQKLPVTGQLDAATKAKLKEEHGC
jgi:hypothetical protein